MGKKKTTRGVLLTANLPQLQNLIKRDPEGYREEFIQQLNHYESIRRIFEIKPDDDDDARRFRDLVNFLSQVAPCYPKETAEFPAQLSSLLLGSYATLSPDTRKALVHNLVLLRNKDVISSLQLLQTLFPLLPRTTSSTLRTFIRKTILSDIRTANLKSKNHKLNRAVQAMLFGMVERGMDAEVQGDKGKLRGHKHVEGLKISGEEAMWAVTLTKELWKKGIWNDAKSVSIVALGCFHPVIKVQSAAIHFFLGSEDEEAENSDEEGRIPDIKHLQHKRTVTKKTASGEKKMEKAIKLARKRQAEKRNNDNSNPNFPALQLLHDPQTFAEKLYEGLNKYDQRFSLDHKILVMQLLSRVMGSHKLCVLGFYTYIVKYLTYHQLRITVILVSLAQSAHDLTPPDVLTPVIHKLAKEFVHPGVSSEVIAAGINAIREVCRRQPWCMEEDLLGDLVEYHKSKDKGVFTASRSLMQLYRDVNPSMLHRRHRGKAASMGIQAGSQPLPFGHAPEAAVGIEGLELLEEHLEQKKAEAGNDEALSADEEDDWNGWEVESDDSEESDSGSWIDVNSEGPSVEVSDSEDEAKLSHKKVSVVDDKMDSDPRTPAETEEAPTRVQTLATTKILTPADYAMLNELRIQAAAKAVESGGGSAAKRKLATLEANRKLDSNHQDNTFLSETDILGPRKKAKADYAERMESIQKGREGREKFGSSKGKKKHETPTSSTNREKARNKPIMMILGSAAVRGKKKQSLREKQRRLRAHIEAAKKSK